MTVQPILELEVCGIVHQLTLRVRGVLPPSRATGGNGSGRGRAGCNDPAAADGSGNRCSDVAQGDTGRSGADARGIGSSGDGCAGGGTARGAPARASGVAKVGRTTAMGAHVVGCAGCGGCEGAVTGANGARLHGARLHGASAPSAR